MILKIIHKKKQKKEDNVARRTGLCGASMTATVLDSAVEYTRSLENRGMLSTYTNIL